MQWMVMSCSKSGKLTSRHFHSTPEPFERPSENPTSGNEAEDRSV